MTDDRVTVTGAASRAVAPATATWRAEAVEGDADPRAAFERATLRMNALLEGLAGVGEVDTDAVVVQPRWEEHGPKDAEAIGAVRVESPAERAGEVAQAAMAAGADRLHGPRYVYDWQAVHEELLAEALEAARRKAERLAAAAGRRLGRVLAIDEQGTRRVDDHGIVAFAVSETPDVRPREQTVTAELTVVFALEA